MVSMSAPTAGAARDERRDDGAGSGGHCSIARVRRLLGWIGGVVGGIAAYRWLRGRPPVAPEPSAEPAPDAADERAEELRAKLAESRVAEPVVEETPPESVAEEEPGPPPEPESPEDRRARVHEEGRAALDEMRSDGAG
jgi:hypothetical protein